MTSVVIAYDGSGSTGGCSEYHAITQRVAGEYPNATILLWDNVHRVISAEDLAEINRKKKGFGGTSPKEIAEWVREHNFHGRLVIITDGEVHIHEVDACTRLLGEWNFEYVDAHLIGGSVNMSITCPFTRISSHSVTLYQPHRAYVPECTTQVSTDDLELLTSIDRISTVEEFQAVAAKLESVLVARTMGTNGNMELRDKLLAMKKRINSGIATAAGETDAAKEYVSSVTEHRYDAGVVAARRLTAEYFAQFDTSAVDVSGSTWSSKVSRMIAMTEGALRGVFSIAGITAGIQSDRIRRAAGAIAPTSAPAATSGAAAEYDASHAEFMCPITLDAERDVVLLVKAGEPLLAGVDKHIVDDLLDCPLNLMKYSDLIERLVARLDHPLSLTAYASGGDWSRSPMTREPLLRGAICFGAAADHVGATQWTLAKLFTGGKLAGNPDFWYACIWWVLTHKCPSYLESLKPFADAHMRWRLQHQSSFIALSGLPEFPTTHVPLGCAIWYVLASPLFSNEFGANRDVLRGHIPHLAPLLELVELAGYAIPDGLKRHYARLRTMLRYLAWIKADRVTLPMRTRMLIQAHIPSGAAAGDTSHEAPPYIPIDGAPSAEQVQDARKHLRADPLLSIDELVGIAGMVSPQKSAADIPLPLEWEPATASHVVEWHYGLGAQEPIHLTICPATCRPLYMYGDETWRDIATRRYGPVEKQISVHEYYSRYVQQHMRYPSRTDLLLHLYKRVVLSGKHTTLPAAVVQFVDEICSDYAPLAATISPEEFSARWRASVCIKDRQQIEQGYRASYPRK